MRKPKKKLKLKTKRAAMKRFKLTAGRKIKRGNAFKRHILTKKASGRQSASWAPRRSSRPRTPPR